MNDFIFDGNSYTAPAGNAVDFAFSSDRQYSAVTELSITLTQSVQYQYSVALISHLDLISNAGGYWPLQLRFNQLWVAPKSPLTIRFGDFGSEVLRFDETWLEATSPIQLRFDGISDSGDTGSGGQTGTSTQILGIAVGMGWSVLRAIERHIAQNERASDIDNRIDLPCYGDVEQKRFAFLAQTKKAIGQRLISLNSIKPALTRRSHVRWSLPQPHTIKPMENWFTGEDHQVSTDVSWHGEKLTHHRTTQRFSWGEKAHSRHHLSWYGPATRTKNHIRWGFTEPRWVCSDKWLDFAPKGAFSLTFDEPFSTNASLIVLRFDTVPMVCHWDNGGGTINGSPTLPPIDFKVPIEPQIRRLYLMQPVLTCHRVSDELELVIKSVSITDSRSQFVSTANIEFSSKGDAELAKNQLLRININGYDYFVISEQPSKREAWNSGSYTSNGRGKAAELLTPWDTAISYSNSAARSFAGVLGDLIENTGWTIALSGVTDFTIPAGIATISDKTPLEAVNEFVGMVGCMLSQDDANNIITVLPRWPTSPWLMDSATADVNIHDAVIIDYSSNETISEQCNASWVRGEQQGVDAKVTLTGTAGDIATADISNALIVDVIAARLAGTNAIAETGNGEDIQVSLPVMADLPPLKKGQLVGVTWRTDVYKALCDAVTISASVDDNGAVTVQQQAKLLRKLN